MMDLNQLGYFLYMDQQEKKAKNEKLQVNQNQFLVSGRSTQTQNLDNSEKNPIKGYPPYKK